MTNIYVAYLGQLPMRLIFQISSFREKNKNKSGHWYVVLNDELYDSFETKQEAEACATNIEAFFL